MTPRWAVCGTPVAHWFNGYTQRMVSGEASKCGLVIIGSVDEADPDDGRARCGLCLRYLAAEKRAAEKRANHCFALHTTPCSSCLAHLGRAE